jgi:UDP-glucose 4-epimerase
MHFCASSLVGESVQQPYGYYQNNVAHGLVLLEAMREAGINRLVFSSTAATYGTPQQMRIDERHPQQPINPYGASKAMVERILLDAAAAYGLRSVALRYFNAAGADPDGGIGELHQPETHLIPNVLRATLDACGHSRLKIFGDDYDTPDGTCLRDYVHVNDLALAHLKALEFMLDNDGAHAFNLGNGEGFSVREVIDAAEQVIGRPVPFDVEPRRAGDPPTLIADSHLARVKLQWKPAYTQLDRIIATAWTWHQQVHALGSKAFRHGD